MSGRRRASRKHDGISLLLDPGRRAGRRAAPDPDSGPAHPRHQRGVPHRRRSCPRRHWSAQQDEAWKVMLSNLELERVLMSGGYVGVAQSTLDEAVAYSKERRAFGRADRHLPVTGARDGRHAGRDRRRPAAGLPRRVVAQPGPAEHAGRRDGQAEGFGDVRRRGPSGHADLRRPRLLHRECDELPLAGVDRCARSPAAPARSSATASLEAWDCAATDGD